MTANSFRNMGRWRMAFFIVSVLLWAGSCTELRAARTDSLEEKLETITDYVPKAVAPVDQLVEVAQKFKIPMGIEWVDKGRNAPVHSLSKRTRSVRKLLEEIASTPSEYRVEVDNGLVRIYSPTAAVHPFNFLNLVLESYTLKDGDLFDAEHELRLAITFTLEPEKYSYGYNGGYGHGANHIFQVPKFSLSISNVTIREILNRIALAQGNALWVATVKSSDLRGDEPSWNRKRKGGKDLPTTAWHFYPLAEIDELAKQQVGIDVTIAGVLDERMTTIPVMLDEGLFGSSGGTIGGSSSDGNSYQYGVSIEKIGKNSVTLLVHLKVGFSGEGEMKFEERFEVYNDRISEIQPEARIRIRAYFEPRPLSTVCRPGTLRQRVSHDFIRQHFTQRSQKPAAA